MGRGSPKPGADRRVARHDQVADAPRVSPCARGSTASCWTTRSAPAIRVTDHGLHRRRRGLRGRQGRRRPAVRPRPAPRPAGHARPPASGCPAVDVDVVRARRRGRARRRAPDAGAAPDHPDRRARAARLGPRRPPADARRRGRRRWSPLPPTSVVDRAVAAQRARRARRPQDDVVRRERRGPGRGPAATARARRSSPTSPATCARAPARTSSTSSTASCAPRRWPAAAWPASPGPWCSTGAAAREVDEPIEVAEAADEVFLASTTRDVQSVVRWGRRELAGRPGHPSGRWTWRSASPSCSAEPRRSASSVRWPGACVRVCDRSRKTRSGRLAQW